MLVPIPLSFFFYHSHFVPQPTNSTLQSPAEPPVAINADVRLLGFQATYII